MEVVEEAVPSLLIEVCVDSVESAVNAVHGGADRLEVCANLGIGGGTTPSLGLVRSIQKAVKDTVPLMVMIRPRVGDFRYSHHEIDVMLGDIASFKELGVRGFVVGALSEDGRVDIETMKRAFDMTRDPEEALCDIIEIGGISRVLTSGHAARAPESVTTLERLFDAAKQMTGHDLWGLTLMPGSGINSKTIGPVVEHLLPKGLREIHLSGGSGGAYVIDFIIDTRMILFTTLWHCTFLVNSLAHKDGLQPYSDEDTSRGNLLLAILTGGEGNHNFHHTFPHDFRSGPSMLDWDPSKWIILALNAFGWVHGLRRAKQEDVKEAAHYMHQKYSGDEQLKEPSADETEDEWQGPLWDATPYLREHPGGASLLRSYSSEAIKDRPDDAQWAFYGGLNKHSRAAKNKMRGLRIAKLNN
ncbi:hypothetical protein MD484_g1993, partial [Candolleomyces efflorescens]